MMATTRQHCSTCLLTFDTTNDLRHAITYFLPELQLANQPLTTVIVIVSNGPIHTDQNFMERVFTRSES
jgi:hypothetical protein